MRWIDTRLTRGRAITMPVMACALAVTAAALPVG